MYKKLFHTDSTLSLDHFHLNQLLTLTTFKHTVDFGFCSGFNIVVPVFPSYKGGANISPLESSSRLPNFSTKVEVQDRAVHVQRYCQHYYIGVQRHG